jgi:hypothetical protein
MRLRHIVVYDVVFVVNDNTNPKHTVKLRIQCILLHKSILYIVHSCPRTHCSTRVAEYNSITDELSCDYDSETTIPIEGMRPTYFAQYASGNDANGSKPVS